MTAPTDRRIGDFPFSIQIPTRWGDNDQLGHLNNVVYNRCIETVVMHFTLGVLKVDWKADQSYPLVVESLCRFHRPLSFPETVTAGLGVQRIGGTSTTYEIGLFGEGVPEPASTGHFVHVFIDRDSQKSVQIPAALRAILESHQMK